jgi:hypothetical protein
MFELREQHGLQLIWFDKHEHKEGATQLSGVFIFYTSYSFSWHHRCVAILSSAYQWRTLQTFLF